MIFYTCLYANLPLLHLRSKESQCTYITGSGMLTRYMHCVSQVNEICNSYTMARRDLPDIYAIAQEPQAQVYSRLAMV